MSLTRSLTRPLTSRIARKLTSPSAGGGYMTVNSYRADTAPAALSIATYDGGNQLVHPSVWDSVRETGGAWNGYRYWLAATPYAGSSIAVENPCIYASDSLDGPWVVPDGLTNPIEPQPSGGYNSDTHLVYGRDGYLYCVWRANESVEPLEKIYYLRSSDGIVWGDKTLMRESNSAVARIASPAVGWDGTQWVMYGVDTLPATNTVVRMTADALSGPWSAPETCSISMPSGRDAWHLDAHFLSGAWWILISDSPLGSSTSGNLYLCRTTNGIDIERADLPVMPLVGNWHIANYRSCLVPQSPAGFGLVYTGVDAGPVYYLGHTQINAFNLAQYEAEPETAIAGALAGTPPYLLGDNFNRADGALGTSTAGEVWSIAAGAPEVFSNQARAGSDANNIAQLSVSSGDFYVELDIESYSTLSNQIWIIFRKSDASNLWRAGFNGGQMTLQKIVAGAVTSVYAKTGGAPGQSGLPTSERIAVRCTGSNVSLLLNGSVSLSTTDSFNSTATIVGWQTAKQANLIDNFFARDLVNGL